MRIRLASFRAELMFILLGRLLLILLTNEIVIMLACRGFGLDAGLGSLPGTALALVDGVLLTVLSAPPIYFWIIVPVLRERRRTDETLQLLATVTRNAHESIRLNDDIASIEGDRPACSTEQSRC